jgi:hypothetical protein
MGLFDFLKVTVPEKKKTAPQNRSCVEFDNKSFPLAAITTKGFVATQFDNSLVRGQNARVVVKVDDEFRRFSFATTIGVNETSGGKLVGEWSMLTPEVEGAIRSYVQIRKRKAGS